MKILIHRCVVLALALLCYTNGWAQLHVSGKITDAKTGESLIGVTVYNIGKTAGTTTNTYGVFTFTLPEADTLVVSYMGYQKKYIWIAASQQLSISLNEVSAQLKEVEVKEAIQKQPHGTQTVNLNWLKNLPAVGGERDLIKALQIMPGIKKGAEGTVGMFVRGGGADQNLILLDDAPVYNAAHLLGFFSLFNTDAIKEAHIQTGGFTANYGGRLSSVLNVTTQDGNRQQNTYQLSTGLLATRAMAQGPLLGKRGSFLVAGRISYIDKVYRLVDLNLPVYFYDVNAKLSYSLSTRDQLFFSAYQGDDVLREEQRSTQNDFKLSSNLGNKIYSFRWNHQFDNKRMFANLSLFSSKYRYTIKGDLSGSLLQIDATISDKGIKYQIEHQLHTKWYATYGAELIQHTFLPNRTRLVGAFNENLKTQQSPINHLIENAVFFSTKAKLKRSFDAQFGMRVSAANGKDFTYILPEPRALLTYHMNSSSSFSVSYAKMVQYMFLLSGSSVMLPTDLWYGVTKQIKPLQAHHWGAGYQFQKNNHLLKSEVYYKHMTNLVEYREGTVELAGSTVQDIAVQGNGRAYGLEVSYQVNYKKWNLLAAYTLAKSSRHFEALNNGESYLDRYDRRHEFNMGVTYKISQHFSVTGLWCYATGSRYTPVIGQFMMPNGNFSRIDLLPIYGPRNSIRLADAHRLDVNLTYKSKRTKGYEFEAYVGAYNVYNRAQPYRIKMRDNGDGTRTPVQMGLFGFLPAIGCQFKF